MDTVYHWLGFGMAWVLLITVGVWAACKAYDYIRLNDYWLWMRTYLLRKPWRLKNKDGVGWLVRNYQAPINRDMPHWKRNLAAYTIRYNRRMGFKDE